MINTIITLKKLLHLGSEPIYSIENTKSGAYMVGTGRVASQQLAEGIGWDTNCFISQLSTEIGGPKHHA